MTSNNDDNNTTQAARTASDLDPAQRLTAWLEAGGGFVAVFHTILLSRPLPRPFKSRKFLEDFLEAELFTTLEAPPTLAMPIEGLSRPEVIAIFLDWLRGTELFVLFHVNLTLNGFAASKL